uniref:Retrovirus-related Pol polyprotein from transposon 297 family n=1 Tax=Cajanus cajan TaxID=3821 RepID=A0A151SPB8_CAJCA|nr:Retrovirus-related Pol polyprotein from transposon 297 family [Cajanus cajan]
MEGKACHGFQYWRNQAKHPSWAEFTRALLKRYGENGRGTVYERLATIRQTGSVEDYVQEFELLIAQAKPSSEEQVLGYFLAGLRSDIRSQVRPHDPKELNRAMEIAHDIEEAMNDIRNYGKPQSHNSNSRFRYQGNNTIISRVETPGTNREPQGENRPSSGSTGTRQDGNIVPPTRPRGTRNLPYREYIKHREENRCFHCGLAFGPGHRCPEKNLRVIILADEESSDPDSPVLRGIPPPGECNWLDLSICSAGGLTTPHTMKLKGKLFDRDILLLIDSGVSHNFISQRLVTELDLTVYQTKTSFVRLGDGNQKQTYGSCNNVQIRIGDYTMTGEFFIFDLGGVDIILGVAWLMTLGEVKVNWRTLQMQLIHQGQLVTIQGDPSLSKEMITTKAPGYYRRFICDYDKIARPLTDLLKKGSFHWSATSTTAFKQLQSSVTTAPVLTVPDFAKPFEIECDASGKGVGAVLMRDKKPIAFFSKGLEDSSLTKSIYEKELMALVLAIQHWRPYLLGRKFTVYTDQKSLRYLLEQRITTQNQQNWLHHKGRLVLSATSSWIPKLLHEFHTSPTGGHSGIYRIYRRMAQSLFWIGMKQTVTQYVASCHVCQRSKYQASSPAGLLQPLPIPNAVWEEISMDFIVGLPRSKGFEAIMVVVDRLSKYGHFVLIKHPYSARTISAIFVKEIIRLHGILTSIVSDRDPTFMSHFWQELFRLQGT